MISKGRKIKEPLVKNEKIITTLENGNRKKDIKIKFKIYAKKLEQKVKLNESQQEYSKKIRNNQITFCIGQAGTSKTFSACYTLLKLLFEEKIDKIVFTKPIQEAGENLGFLPGDMNEKMAPYVESFIYTCKEILSPDIVDFLIENGFIECRPLAFMRGITMKNCGMFLDEGQNTKWNQLMLYITRLGDGSKMVIAGDMTQRDIAKKDSVFYDFINLLKGIDGIAIHEFQRSDIVRNKILIEITERYEIWKEKNKM